MLNPIKRVWVPKAASAPAPDPAPAPALSTSPPTATPSAVVPTVAPPAAEPIPSKRGMLFDELPEPEVTEKFSDSVWAEFDSVIPQSTK